MGTELQKATAELLTFQKQPERFLAEMGSYLETLQFVYRTKLPPQELVLWRDTLKDYSYQEFNRAMTHLIANPPKYEIEGEVQVWRGMPKLPDVIDVMLNFRDKDVAAAREKEAEARRKEFAELEKRRAEHPEEFMSWGDFCARLRVENPELAAKIGMTFPAKESLSDAELERKKQEAIELAKKFS